MYRSGGVGIDVVASMSVAGVVEEKLEVASTPKTVVLSETSVLHTSGGERMNIVMAGRTTAVYLSRFPLLPS